MEITDKSLFRCTIKKSADVVKKLAKYVAYVAVGLIACVLSVYGAVGIWVIAADPAYKYLTAIISFLFSIPWYCYAGIVAIAAIPVYSFLWCVARELTEEDWKSDEAEILAIAFAGIAIAFVAIAIAIALAAFAFAGIAIAFVAIAIAIALAAFAAFAFAGITFDSKAFQFIGAYLHYRKRVKAE